MDDAQAVAIIGAIFELRNAMVYELQVMGRQREVPVPDGDELETAAGWLAQARALVEDDDPPDSGVVIGDPPRRA